MAFRKDTSNINDWVKDPISYNDAIIKAMKEKSNHNKFESQMVFGAVIVCSLAAPVFVTLGEGLFWGKIVPAVLSLLAAASTSWLQLRKPQRLWALYRGAQRHLEDERVKFQFRLNSYSDCEDPDRLLAQKTGKIALDVHYKWEGIVPDPDSLGTIVSGGASSREVENDR